MYSTALHSTRGVALGVARAAGDWTEPEYPRMCRHQLPPRAIDPGLPVRRPTWIAIATYDQNRKRVFGARRPGSFHRQFPVDLPKSINLRGNSFVLTSSSRAEHEEMFVPWDHARGYSRTNMIPVDACLVRKHFAEAAFLSRFATFAESHASGIPGSRGNDARRSDKSRLQSA